MEEYKGYSIKFSQELISYEVEYIGRGSSHKSLRGFFTDKRTAKKFIDIYLNRKEEEDGKTVTSRGNQPIRRRTRNRRQPSNDS